MAATVDRLGQEEGLSGVIFASAKKTFFAGGDLNELLAVAKGDEGEFLDMLAQHDAEGACLRPVDALQPVIAVTPRRIPQHQVTRPLKPMAQSKTTLPWRLGFGNNCAS